MRRNREVMLAVGGSLLIGCPTVDSNVGWFGTGDGGVPIDEGSGAVGSADGVDGSGGGGTRGDAAGTDAGDDPADDDGGIKLDVWVPDGGPGCPDGDCSGCNAVDLLFVIDNSVSMGEHQVALSQAFPTFAGAIVDALPPNTSLHVGVTSTTMGHSNGGSTNNCIATGDGGQPAEAFYTTPDVSNNGVNGAQGRLYEAAGQPYFEINTGAGPMELEALATWFSEAANIGESGSQVEMSAAAAGWAADPANDATNAGFLRDEGAVLVVFFIQDEPDQTPMSAAADLVSKIEAAKAGCGGMDCVVGGGFVNQNCLPQVPLGVLFDSFGAPPVVESLPLFGSDPEIFVPVLGDTLAQVIAQTCEQIPPAG